MKTYSDMKLRRMKAELDLKKLEAAQFKEKIVTQERQVKHMKLELSLMTAEEARLALNIEVASC